MRDAYREFLGSSSLDTWWKCLEAYRPIEGGWLDDEAVAEALCISYYVQWLSGEGGDSARSEQAKALSDRLLTQLDSLHGSAPSAATRRGWAFALAWRGYGATARALVVDEVIPVELLLMTTPADRAACAAELRPYASGDDVFPPARIVYCGALMDIGAFGDAEALLSRSDLDERDPLVRGLIGSNHERAGHWREACTAYKHEGPEWPGHRYRAMLCRLIADAAETPVKGHNALPVDEAISDAMSRFDSEIGQAEVARSTAFVNSCLWQIHDNWVVHYELGKLNFRRRRYFEADVHLRKAVRMAPDSCKRVIASLRFTNLTWVSESSLVRNISMTPETLEAGLEALEYCDRPDQLTHVRTWLAAQLEVSKLDPHPLDAALGLHAGSVEAWEAYNRGEIHRNAGDRPEALACWLECLREGYHHRSVLELVSVLSAARFALSADYLVQLIMRESEDDFFALWELAHFLLSARGAFSESSVGFERLSARLQAVMDRMIELAQFEFQHLIRAYEFFAQTNRQDMAEALLRRAATLAESPAEKLAVAVARRLALWFQAAEGDPEAVALLEGAERESRDRMERLQIAGELFRHGRLQRGQRILEEERIFDAHTVLEHVEYVAALLCGPWMKREEVEALLDRALDALGRDVKNGAIHRFGRLHFRRLIRVVALTDVALAERLPRRWSLLEPEEGAGPGPPTPERAPGPWRAWRDTVTACEEPQGRARMLIERIQGFRRAGDLEDKLATWVWLQHEIAAALDSALTARPHHKMDIVPISKTLSLEDDPRVLQLCDLWREFLAHGDTEKKERAREGLAAWEDEEAELLGEWERLRRVEAEGPLANALVYLEASVELASGFDDDAMEGSHPILAGLYEHVAKDARRVAEQLAARAEALRVEAST